MQFHLRVRSDENRTTSRSLSLQKYNQGGLAARSGTEFT